MEQNNNSLDTIKVVETLTRIETKVDVLGNVREIAIEAQQSAKSSHLRIDKLDKLVFWIGTTIVGGLLAGAIGLLFHFAKQ